VVAILNKRINKLTMSVVTPCQPVTGQLSGKVCTHLGQGGTIIYHECMGNSSLYNQGSIPWL